jgi:DNA-binding transcriptional MerR regulator
VEKAPDAFRTISEVADDLDIPQHVLRFWESRFSQIKPMKRGGGRRYYRPDDVALLRGIRHLLYGQGYTIRGVQRILREQGIRFAQTVWEAGAEQPLSSDEDGAGADMSADEAEDNRSEDESPRRLLERLRAAEAAAEPRRPAMQDTRLEPTFTDDDGDDRDEPPSQRPAGITPGQRQSLRSALDELAECRRMLESALDEA